MRKYNGIFIPNLKKCVMLFLLLGVVWLPSVRVSAATNYKSIYKTFLSKEKTMVSINGYARNITMKSYYMLDIDKDKIPELIVKDREPQLGAASYDHYIFTIRKKKVVFCDALLQRGTADIFYNKKYKALQNSGWTNFVGGVWYHLFRLKSKKLVQYAYIWEGYSDTQNTEYIYYIGRNDTEKKKVSKTKYKEFVKKYFNKKDLKVYKFKANTAKNREKTFG